ncbi:glycogen synthase GlgA [Clostridium sediminicola]|uniref:glycogen synthase GlgA n=1 Tax=Clostridium sediminicola TaxID=3114879 RepID=UPI0031F227C9
MKVLFVASEAFPFIKTGGLGDVAYALPKALRRLGVDARVIIPKYSLIKDEYKKNMTRLWEFQIPVGYKEKYCGLWKLEYDEVPFYFIDNEEYFKRSEPYGEYDDGEKFAYFSKAVLESIIHFDDFVPDILHCNDWHTAMCIPMLQEFYQNNGIYSHMKTVFTIHNLRYQGVFGKEILWNSLGLGYEYYHEDKLKFYDGVSFMKGGIVYANAVSTVSPTYAEEIKNDYFGEGLHGLLRTKSLNLFGILNGLDTELNDPKTDKHLFENYDENNLDKKAKNKEKLQKMLNLPVNKDIPMIGMVTRLADQKGLDLVQAVIEDILQEDIQFVVLGTGDRKFEDMFKFFAWKYPDKMSSNIFFDLSLAQKIYGSSDMFLMPSKFEPCGIGQLIALKYGSIPIVRETGGLNDTVSSYNDFTGEGNGFSFVNYNAHDMLYTIRRAIGCYWNKKIWNNLVTKGMAGDYTWCKSAKEYVDMYHWAQDH